jgi:poly-gamma-glutamate capsule biosynthesis protein CapA/YwtB (metallophosphatase superfamily)
LKCACFTQRLDYSFLRQTSAPIRLSFVLTCIALALTANATSVLFGGDMMLNSIAPSPKVFAGITQLTASCDLAFGNLEIPLTSSRTRTTRKNSAELKLRNQWILKANPRHAQNLFESGIHAVSLANNHAMDFGPSGLTEITSLLDKYKINHAGAGKNAAEAMQDTVITLSNKKRIALLSALGFVTTAALRKTTPATLDSPGIGVLNLRGLINDATRQKLASWIATARIHADIVVVAMHWGVERKSLPIPYQVSLGRALIDAGADVVWGNHPHVLQGAEMYKRKLIMYSMGNLFSSLPAQGGFFKVKVGEDGTQSLEFIPSDVHGGKVTLLKPRQARSALAAMRKLCRLLQRRYPSPVSVPAL